MRARERKREGGEQTSSSAWLLLCFSPLAGRPCCVGAPASPLGLLHLPWSCSCISAWLLLYWCAPPRVPATSGRPHLLPATAGHPHCSFEWPSPSAGPPASSHCCLPQVHPHHTCPSALRLSIPVRPLPHLVFWLTKSAAFHICLLCLCSYWCVYWRFLYYIIGLSHTHIRSRLMPACAWVVIFFEHYITQSGSFFD